VELAVQLAATNPVLTHVLAAVFFLLSFFFVYRSFYGMRIGSSEPSGTSQTRPEMKVSAGAAD
jgi:K(+)-stimulated pyrophosphate-energized sodium pump